MTDEPATKHVPGASRRKFLKGSAALGAGVIAAEPPAPKGPIR